MDEYLLLGFGPSDEVWEVSWERADSLLNTLKAVLALPNFQMRDLMELARSVADASMGGRASSTGMMGASPTGAASLESTKGSITDSSGGSWLDSRRDL